MKIDRFDILHILLLTWAGYLAFYTEAWVASMIIVVATGLLVWIHGYRRNE